MLSKRTCLLLGAGASCHLGFPLGNGLKQEMLTRLRKYLKSPEEMPPALAESGDDLQAFYEELAFGNWHSPDAFLEKRREFINSGKYLICEILSGHENVERLVDRGGWYVRQRDAIHADSLDEFVSRSKQLSIVTFNYDRSIDCWLHRYVMHQFRLPVDDAWAVLRKVISIVHVHGTLGEYPTSCYGDKNHIVEKARSIKIISEVADETPEFNDATALLGSAERVVVFGFGFAKDKCAKVALFRRETN